jgi:hypothetical protein
VTRPPFVVRPSEVDRVLELAVAAAGAGLPLSMPDRCAHDLAREAELRGEEPLDVDKLEKALQLAAIVLEASGHAATRGRQ